MFEQREVKFKARSVSELLGRAGMGLTPANLRDLASKAKPKLDEAGAVGGAAQNYHYTYTPIEIREIRKKISPEFARRAEEKPFPPVILFRMSKGGVGKTSISGNVGFALAAQGYRVLIIDGDSQHSLSDVFGIDTEDENLKTIYSLLVDGAKVHEAAIRVYADMPLDVIPADDFVASFDSSVLMKTSREFFFRRFLRDNQDYLSANYDLILIDSAPGTTFLSFNFLVSCSLMISPVRLDGFSMKSLKKLKSEVREVENFLDVPSNTLPVRVVANVWQPAYSHHPENLEVLEREFGDKLLKSRIPSYVGFERQMTTKGSNLLFAAEPTHAASKVILEMSREILRLTGIEG